MKKGTLGWGRWYWIPVFWVSVLIISLMLNLGTSAQPFQVAESADNSTNPVYSQTSRLLPIPYIKQGAANWCFQTSLAMVLQYYGKRVIPSDIANSLGKNTDDSVSVIDVFFGSVDSYLSRWQEFNPQHHITNWSFDRYVELIDSDTPVIVSTFGLRGHTVVVTGYSKEEGESYLYMHDPSGYYSNLQWDAFSPKFAKVKWSQFSKNLWTQLYLSKASR